MNELVINYKPLGLPSCATPVGYELAAKVAVEQPTVHGEGVAG